MKEALVYREDIFVPHDQSAEPSEPSEGSFNLPTALVSAKGSTVLRGFAFTPFTMRTHHLDPTLTKAISQWIRVVCAIQDQLQVERKIHFGPIKRAFNQLYFCGRGGGKSARHRNTLAVNHHHPLRSLAPLRGSDTVAPLFAGANDASAKASLQSRASFRDNRSTNEAQISSQIPSSSHRLKRRQQVVGWGYPPGKSRHRAPVFRTHKMASKTSRSLLRGRPVLAGGGRYHRISSQSSSEHRRSFIPHPTITLYNGVQVFSFRVLQPVLVF